MANDKQEVSKKCEHTSYTPQYFTPSLGCLVGGLEECPYDAVSGAEFCWTHTPPKGKADD